MKKWLCMLTVLALAVSCLLITAAAEEPVVQTAGDFQYTKRTDGTAEITGYTGTDEELTIPAELDVIPVTALGRYAFSYCSTLTDVTVPDSVTVIGDFAFYSCSNLKSVTLPAGVDTVGINPFYKCKSLQEITVPDESEYLAVEDYTLICTPEKKMICFISGSVDELSDDPIDYCDVPEGTEVIGDYAMSACDALVEVTIPVSVKAIGNRAFRWSKALKTANIGENVATIGELAFAGCQALEEIIIPDSVTAIGDRAFNYCSHLKVITFPAGMKEIRDQDLFTGCEKIHTVVLPEGITSIASGAFKDCVGLSEINIPGSLTSIDMSAFANGENMIVTTDFGTAAAEMLGRQGLPFRVPGSECDVLVVYDEAGENITAIRVISGNEKAKEKGATMIFKIPEGVTEIAPAAFKGYEGLVRVYIPDSVTAIGEEAFAGCADSMRCYTGEDSYARKYCEENGLKYVLPNEAESTDAAGGE